jgi:hypothetical protein
VERKIFLTFGPELGAIEAQPIPRWGQTGQDWPNLAKTGQIWTQVAKFGQRWPNLDKTWTTKNPSLLGTANHRKSVKALFSPSLRGAAAFLWVWMHRNWRGCAAEKGTGPGRLVQE